MEPLNDRIIAARFKWWAQVIEADGVEEGRDVRVGTVKMFDQEFDLDTAKDKTQDTRYPVILRKK